MTLLSHAHMRTDPRFVELSTEGKELQEKIVYPTFMMAWKLICFLKVLPLSFRLNYDGDA